MAFLVPDLTNESGDIVNRVPIVIIGAAHPLKFFEESVEALLTVGPKGLSEQLADRAAFRFGRSYDQIPHVGRERNRELFRGALHAYIIT